LVDITVDGVVYDGEVAYVAETAIGRAGDLPWPKQMRDRLARAQSC